MKGFLATKASFRLSNTDMITGGLIIILSIFLMVYAIPYQIDLGFGSSGSISPRTLPYGVAGLMLICGIKILHDGYLEKKRAAIRATRGQQEAIVSFYTLALTMGAMGLVLSGLLSIIGYPLTNIILMVAMYYFSGGTKLKSAAILSVLFTIGAWLFFASYLKLSIPLGFGL